MNVQRKLLWFVKLTINLNMVVGVEFLWNKFWRSCEGLWRLRITDIFTGGTDGFYTIDEIVFTWSRRHGPTQGFIETSSFFTHTYEYSLATHMLLVCNQDRFLEKSKTTEYCLGKRSGSSIIIFVVLLGQCSALKTIFFFFF